MKTIFLLLAGVMFAGTGCKKFLDVNRDPNHPLTVAESLILAPVEFTVATQIAGGYTGMVMAYWMQQLSLNQAAPGIDTYMITDKDVDNTWSFFLYPNVFENLRVMITEAESAGHYQYAAIGKTLFAYNMAITTDLWNDVPYAQALQPAVIPKPGYDRQEVIYQGLQNELDSALYYITLPASRIAPAGDDLIYGGNMEAWKKFIYTLKARYYLRLTRAPGHAASAQANSALTALQKGFASNGDNAAVSYSGSAEDENPWHENTLPGAGGVVMAQSFIDSLISRKDPRLPMLASRGKGGNYLGRQSGAGPASDYTVYSSVNTFYGGYLPLNVYNSTGAAAALSLMTYSEALFIKAEAVFITAGAAAAQPVYEAAIGSHMDLLWIGTATGKGYISTRPLLTPANALEQIITEKYVADFLSIETYNDWRRTGFPQLTLAQNAYVNYIPRRWPYSFTETLTNPQPEQRGVTTASRVWWDAP